MENLTTRQLYNDETTKIHFLTREGKTVREESGLAGKTKVSEKEFPSEDAAKLHVKKKEWDLLRKGFVYRNPSSKQGEAKLHYFLSRLYTGALSFQDTEHGIYVSVVGPDPDPRTDYMNLIDYEGHLKGRIDLPFNSALEMIYSGETDLLFLKLYQYIYVFRPSTREMKAITDLNSKEFSHKHFAVNANAFVFSSEKGIHFTSNVSSVLDVNGKFDFEWERTQAQLAMALSSDAKLLALLKKPETIEIIDTVTGKTKMELSVGTNAIGDMCFFQQNQLLVFKDHESYWKLRFFNLLSGKEISLEWLEQPAYQHVFHYAVNESETRLAVSYGYYVIIYDLVAKKRLIDFQFEHSAKKAEIKFVGDLLGARTDQGCFSLYEVG